MDSQKWFSATLAALILVMTLAVDAANAVPGGYYDDLHEYVDMYNRDIEKIPGFLTLLVRNQYAWIVFESVSGPDEIAGAVTGEDGSVLQYVPSAPFNPTIIVTVRPGTVHRLIAEHSGRAVLDAIGSDIRIEGVGIRGRIRTFALVLIVRVALRFA